MRNYLISLSTSAIIWCAIGALPILPAWKGSIYVGQLPLALVYWEALSNPHLTYTWSCIYLLIAHSFATFATFAISLLIWNWQRNRQRKQQAESKAIKSL